MSSVPLTAKKRHDIGKGAARKARAAGHIPGVLYGPGFRPLIRAVTRLLS